MPDIFVTQALLPTGWASDVLLAVDEGGILAKVVPGAGAVAGADRLDGVAVPGVPNVHSHAFQRALAGLTERRGAGAGADSFWSWRERMYAFLDRLGPEDVEAIATQLYVEMLKAGYTSVAEFHYLHRDAAGRAYDDPTEMSRRVLAAAERAGIGLSLLPVVYMSGDFGGAPPAEGQKRFLLDVEGLAALVERLAPLVRGDESACGDRAGLGVALHSLRAVPPAAIDEAVALWRRLGAGAPIHVHVAEQLREVDACLAWSGARPVEWLLDHAPVDERWCLIHATHMTPEEVTRMAATGAVVGLCPTTEANLGDGLFPLRAYLEAGGALAVGSDSHVSVSPVEELRWLEYGQRLVSRTRNVAAGFPYESTGRSLLEAALAGGARALGRPVGALEVGRRADLVVLDAGHPLLAQRRGDALLDAWIFSGNAPVVRHVVVGGRVVVRDGHHPEEEAAAAGYRDALLRVTSEL